MSIQHIRTTLCSCTRDVEFWVVIVILVWNDKADNAAAHVISTHQQQTHDQYKHNLRSKKKDRTRTTVLVSDLSSVILNEFVCRVGVGAFLKHEVGTTDDVVC